MKRNLALLLSAAFLMLGTQAYAFPDTAEMRSNYTTCVNGDSSWYHRFGQYIVAFDLDTARKVCVNQDSDFVPHLAACNVEGGWLYAGYYCERRGHGHH